MEKTCKTCGAKKPIAEFPRLRTKKQGTASSARAHCLPCWSVINKTKQKQWREKNPEKDKINSIKYFLREILVPEKELPGLVQIWKERGLCPICMVKQQECFDHDHDTGQVRGLICKNCNSGLGMFGDRDPSILDRAAAYLRGAPISSPPNKKDDP